MPKKILLCSMIALAMLTFAFTAFAVGAPSAYAAGVPTTTTITKTQIGRVSAQACATMKKIDPALAEDPQFCEFSLVTTDVITQPAVRNGMDPTRCGTPTITHTESYTELPGLWHYSQTGTFHWDGSCTDRPIVYSHSCGGLWAIPGWIISQSYCGTYPNGTGQTQMEDDILYGSYIGGTFPANMYSDWYYNCYVQRLERLRASLIPSEEPRIETCMQRDEQAVPRVGDKGETSLMLPNTMSACSFL